MNKYKQGDILIRKSKDSCYHCKTDHVTAISIFKYKGFGTKGHKYSYLYTRVGCPKWDRWKIGGQYKLEIDLDDKYRRATKAERILFL